jgi:hypothetical protein
MRELLIEVTVMYPNGETLDSWKMIKRFYVDLPEENIREVSTEVGKKIADVTESWVKENPDTTSVDEPKT